MWRRDAATTAAGTAALLFRATCEDFFGGDYGVGVDGYGVFDVLRVAAGVGDHHGDIAGAGYAEDEFVTLL